MKLDLTPAQVKLLDTILGLDLEAIGLSAAQQRTAHAIRVKLLDGAPEVFRDFYSGPPAAREITAHDPLRVLRLTPSFRHEDK